MDDEQGREEFELFFHAYAHRFVAEAFLLTGDQQDAQDLVQEVLAHVWQHWPSVAEHDHPEAWGRRVMRNLAANRWRRSLLATAPSRWLSPNTVRRLTQITSTSSRPCSSSQGGRDKP